MFQQKQSLFLQKKEAVGDSDTLPQEILDKLETLVPEDVQVCITKSSILI